jgi:hypothetical protein
LRVLAGESLGYLLGGVEMGGMCEGTEILKDQWLCHLYSLVPRVLQSDKSSTGHKESVREREKIGRGGYLQRKTVFHHQK